MCDYVSVESINLRNKIMTSAVLQAYRSGDISYQTLNDVSSPLKEIYENTYNYLQYPSLSEGAKTAVYKIAHSPPSRNGNNDIASRVAKEILPTKK
jgi:hypothetical protein